MTHYVYYLYSPSLKKHYIGKTNDLKRRLDEHNRGTEIFSHKGNPWTLIGYILCETNIDATRLERKLKKAKNPNYIKWYIGDTGILI